MGMNELKIALSSFMGRPITPDLANAIMEYCAERQKQPVFLADAKIKAANYHGYEIRATKLEECLDSLRKQHKQQWDEIEESRPPLNVDYDRYISSERNGGFVQIGAFKSGEFVGGCGFFVYPSIQTRITVAEETALYLLPEHRKGMLAYVMMKYCVDFLRNIGVKEITATVKYYAKTGKIMDRLGFRKTDAVYIIGLEG